METKKREKVSKFPMLFVHGTERESSVSCSEMENKMSEAKEMVLNAAIEEFGKKGLKFTMDDIAKNLSMSKKTLYRIFDTKEAMLLALADYCFTDIKKSEKAIVEDESLDIVTKIEKIMVVLPERYQNIGLSNLYQLKEKYPNIYEKVASYLSTDWDATIGLLEQGIAEGKIRPISIPILQAMVENTIQSFMQQDVLVENGIAYETAMQEMITIIMHGIRERHGEKDAETLVLE